MTALAGTGQLVRLALRRDRILLPGWVLVFASMASSSAAATIKLYPTQADVTSAIRSSNNVAALVALYGRIYDEHSIGAISMLKLTGFGAASVALFAILLVVRHTRADEEAGRCELASAGVLGRHAALAAALIVTVTTCVVLGLTTAFALVGAGLPAVGSFTFGLSWAATGIAFAALAALGAQLSQSARTVRGIVLAALGVSYVLRAAGDASPAGGTRWLSWLSPIGWGQQIRPYASERWWVFALPLALAVTAVAGASWLQAHRDLGTGLVQPRLGPPVGAASLRSPLALAWRLQRGSLVAWAAAFAGFGVVLGSIAGNVGALLGTQSSQEFITKLGGVKNLTDAFLAAEFGFVGVLAAAYAVQAAMRLRSEETEQRLEPLLANPVSRRQWLFSHLVIAWVGTALLVVLTGLGAGLAHGANTDAVGHEVGRLVGAALVQLPATWVMVAIVVVVFGYAPRYASAAWGALVGFVLLGQFGPLFNLSQWVMDLSPFGHAPRLPGADFTPLALASLTGVAVVLSVAGAGGFRRRDIG